VEFRLDLFHVKRAGTRKAAREESGGTRAAHTLVSLYAPRNPSTDELRPRRWGGFWTGQGVPDIKGNVGATRAADFTISFVLSHVILVRATQAIGIASLNGESSGL
jgi:hypothetical protein